MDIKLSSSINITDIKNQFSGHFPVMLREVEFFFRLAKKYKNENMMVLDCTLGSAGHSSWLYPKDDSILWFGFERDGRMISIAKETLKKNQIEFRCLNSHYEEPISYEQISSYGFYIVHKRFSYVQTFLNQVHRKVDFLLCDLGISMYHLKKNWGFSMRDPVLDMSLDPESYDVLKVLNGESETQLANIMFSYGEEKYSRQIAREIINYRPIRSGEQLKNIVLKVYRKKKRKYISEKVVQRTFQALRIYVNQELEELENLMKNLKYILSPYGIAVFISFHSLEDRIIKQYAKELVRKEKFSLLTRKPLQPQEDEKSINPASRSAKMRVIQCGFEN